MKQRLLVVLGTRPEAVKLAPLVHALRAQPWADCHVLSTGQHQAMLSQTLAFFGLQPDDDLALMRPGQTLADLLAQAVAGIARHLVARPPALVLVQGDTSSALAGALAAFYAGVPVAHVEAGLRSGDLSEPFPEEGHRAMLSRLASLHFAPTVAAHEQLLREQIAATTVHTVGNTVIDALLWAAARVPPSAHTPPAGRRLLLVTAHRRENQGPPLLRICQAARQLADRGDVQLLFPLHPNPAVRDEVQRHLAGHPRITLCEPLGYAEMVAALQACALVLTDSGGLQEEAPALGKPVLVLRRDTERPEGVAAGAARLVGSDVQGIVQQATRLLDVPAAYAAMAQPRMLYGDGRSAQAIVAVLRQRFAALQP